ncbi:Hok/Gef family protein [Escherichia coli]|nr:Hok/Gef family protein [Escherichia coli]
METKKPLCEVHTRPAQREVAVSPAYEPE